MLKHLVMAVAIAGCGIAADCHHRLHAQERTARTAGTVQGNWTITAETPHGKLTMALVLEQDGDKVSGTVSTPHGDTAVEGAFTDGSLKLIATVENDRITLTATLKENDTLAGILSSPRGDMEWTAQRVKSH